MLIVCVCVHVCVFTGLKRFSGPLHLKIQPKCGYTAMSSALLKNSKPGKGVQAPYGPRPHIHTHKYTGVCILMLCIQQLECGGISGGMKCLNQLCLLITDHADCWVVHGCDKLMYFIHLSYVCI